MKLSELRQRPHLSASQINQLLNICSLQWYFERVEKLKKPFVSHTLSFGTRNPWSFNNCFGGNGLKGFWRAESNRNMTPMPYPR